MFNSLLINDFNHTRGCRMQVITSQPRSTFCNFLFSPANKSFSCLNQTIAVLGYPPCEIFNIPVCYESPSRCLSTTKLSMSASFLMVQVLFVNYVSKTCIINSFCNILSNRFILVARRTKYFSIY